jgi:hypothetical protein
MHKFVLYVINIPKEQRCIKNEINIHETPCGPNRIKRFYGCIIQSQIFDLEN